MKSMNKNIITHPDKCNAPSGPIHSFIHRFSSVYDPLLIDKRPVTQVCIYIYSKSHPPLGPPLRLCSSIAAGWPTVEKQPSAMTEFILSLRRRWRQWVMRLRQVNSEFTNTTTFDKRHRVHQLEPGIYMAMIKLRIISNKINQNFR